MQQLEEAQQQLKQNYSNIQSVATQVKTANKISIQQPTTKTTSQSIPSHFLRLTQENMNHSIKYRKPTQTLLQTIILAWK